MRLMKGKGWTVPTISSWSWFLIICIYDQLKGLVEFVCLRFLVGIYYQRRTHNHIKGIYERNLKARTLHFGNPLCPLTFGSSSLLTCDLYSLKSFSQILSDFFLNLVIVNSLFSISNKVIHFVSFGWSLIIRGNGWKIKRKM